MAFVPDSPRKSRFVPDQSPAVSRPDPFAGDDLLSDDAMSRLAAGERSTVTPTPSPSPLRGVNEYARKVNQAAGDLNRAKPSGAAGTLEALATLATGAVAAPILGTAESIALGTPPDESFARYTYQPRTESGKAQLGLLGALTQPLADSGADAALLPLASRTQPLTRSRGAPRTMPKENPIPTTEELTKAAKGAYQASKEAGIIVQPEGYSSALQKVRTMAQDQGIDPTLHPKSTAVMKRLEGADGQPLTLQQAETLRKIALDAEDDLNPVTREPTPDARLAGKIVDELDDSIDELTVNSPARAMYARSRRSQMIDRAIERARIKAGANYTQAGMEHALRLEFKQLALNPRRMRGLTAEQRAAVEKVAAGGHVENTLRNIGKFDPMKGGMAAFTGGTLGILTGGPLGLAIPAAGFVGKRAATRLTARNVEKAREALVGRDPAEIPLVAKPAAEPAAAMEGELMPAKPLALPAPNVIAGSRSAPGTAFARQEMGLTPDVEQAGALHPGAARETLISRTAALPQRTAPAALADQRPWMVDLKGRIAATREQLDAYLRETGQDRMRNVRQPRAEPVGRPLGLIETPGSPVFKATSQGKSRSGQDIQADLDKLQKKIDRLPASEPFDSPRSQALEAAWQRLQAELSALAPRG